MLRRFPSYVSILAAIIILVAGFINNWTPYEIGIRLVFVIAVVYFCGIIIRSYFMKTVFVSKNTEGETPEIETGENENKFYESSSFASIEDEDNM